MRKIICLLLGLICLAFSISCGSNTVNYTPVKYDINIYCNEEEGMVYGDECVTFTNDVSREIDKIEFDLYQIQIKTDKNGKLTDCGVKVVKVSDDYGNVDYELSDDGGVLSVKLRKKLKKGQKISLYITFVTTLPAAAEKLGKTEEYINLCDFYPKVSFFDGKFHHYKQKDFGESRCDRVADYSVKAKFNSKYVVCSSGKCISTEVDDDCIVYNYQVNNARGFAFTLSQNYSVLQKNLNGTLINYCYVSDANPQKTFGIIEDCFAFFENVFCKYGYKIYTVAESEIKQNGVEQSCLSLVKNTGDFDVFTMTVVHETAHQWWYNMVGSDEFSFPYIDEALAEYSMIIFLKQYKKADVNIDEYIDDGMKQFYYCKEFYIKENGKFDCSLSRNVDSFSSGYEYISVVYRDGLYAFYSLDELTGGKKLIKALKDVCKKKRYDILSENQLLDALRKRCGRGGEKYFKSFLKGKAV